MQKTDVWRKSSTGSDKTTHVKSKRPIAKIYGQNVQSNVHLAKLLVTDATSSCHIVCKLKTDISSK